MRKVMFPLLIITTLFSLHVSLISYTPKVQAQTPQPRTTARKMSDDLHARARRAQPGSAERTRVILSAAVGVSVKQVSAVLRQRGANLRGQLEALDTVIADVPLNKLEELAAYGEVAWMSADGEVRSLVASTDNASHLEVTTGASRVLPQGTTSTANGGAGNEIGIAILDSGISPADSAEFAGYEWRQSSGTLGTGLLSQSYVATYNRIKKRIDFTGENRLDDAYGHGTHTAGVAAGTGQASEDHAAQNPSNSR
ncbi:MAG: hypothetical protein WKF84_15430 [Pyrinomonadaceae bacterium]